jgi:cytochrome c oxidase subunit 2
MVIPRRRFVIGAGAAAVAAIAGAGAFAAPKARTVKIVARRFQYTPNTVRLKKGEPVVFELTTQDVFMGMNIPDFGVRSDIVPGKTMKLAFTPDKAGTFIFLCDVFCGDGHEGMSGTLVVT